MKKTSDKTKSKNIFKGASFPWWYNALGLFFAILMPLTVLAVWQNPTANPPANNINDPLNTANTAQTKQGTLWISSGNAYLSNPNTYGFIVQNGNVGIGSTTPITTFVVDNAAGSANVLNVGTNRIVGLQQVPINNDEAASRYYVDFRTGGVGTTGIPHAVHAGTTLRADGTNWATSSLLYNDGTNIGIGTTVPNSKLDVVGNININTNGTNALFSTYKGASSDGYNIWIGGGGQSSFGSAGATYQGSYNSAQGYQTLFTNTTGYYNSAQGFQTLYSNTTGYGNSAQGFQALFANILGRYNSAQGAYALQNNTGNYNSAQGAYALQNNTGHFNSAQGAYALQNNTTGDGNSAQGYGALFKNTTGNFNSAQGYNALSNNTTGNYNSAVGFGAGAFIADGTTNRNTGSNGLYLGYNSKAGANGTDNEIVIGYDAIGAGSNTVVLGNNSILKTILKGNVGIASSTPSNTLSVDNVAGSANVLNVGTNRIVGLQQVPINNDEATSRYYVDFRTGGTGTTGIPHAVHTGTTLYADGTNWATSSLLYNNGTNIGIGNASPGALLHVGGNGVSAGTQTWSNAANTVQGNVTFDTGNNWVLFGGITANTGLQLVAGNTARVTVRGLDGNVGIGTTNPQNKLEVNGNTTINAVGGSWAEGLNIDSSNGVWGGIKFRTTGRVANNGNWHIGYDATHSGASGSGNNLYVYTSGTGGYVMSYLENGNVGIGSTTPTTILSIESAAPERINIGGNGYIRGLNTTPPPYPDNAASRAYVDNMSGGGMPSAGNAGYTLYSNGTSWVASSLLYNNGTNIGIGTNNPTYALHLYKASAETGIRTTWGANDIYLSHGGWSMGTAKFGIGNGTTPTIVVDANNYRIGIGTTAPLARLYVGTTANAVSGDISTVAQLIAPDAVVAYPLTLSNAGAPTVGDEVRMTYNFGSGWSATAYVGAKVENISTAATTLTFATYNGTTLAERMTINAAGQVYIPGELKLGAGDVAENFVPDKQYPVGTVLVMADGEAKAVTACHSEYDRLVVGVISEKPAVNMGSETAIGKAPNGLAPIALVGVVKVKVNNSNGNIKRGDLLTTSAVSGEAMKTDDPKVGTIIGKALESSSSNHDSILALINLQ